MAWILVKDDKVDVRQASGFLVCPGLADSLVETNKVSQESFIWCLLQPPGEKYLTDLENRQKN